MVTENEAVNATVDSPDSEPQAPAATTESIESLKAQIAAKDAEIARLDGGYKGLQRTHEKTQEELKRQSDLRAEINDLKETQKLTYAYLAEMGIVKEDESPEERTARLNKANALIQQQAAKKQQDDFIRQGNEVWAAATKFGTPEDNEDVLNIQESLSAGRLDIARTRLARLEKKNAKPEGQTVETQEQKPKAKTWDEMTEDEKDQKILERNKAKGLLKQDTILPSGNGAPRKLAELMKVNTKGMSLTQLEEHKKAILAAQR